MAAPEDFTRIGAAGAPSFSRDEGMLLHLRGADLPQVWAMELPTGAARQLTFHDEKVAFLRRSPVDDRLIYGIDRGGDERQQLLLIDPSAPRPVPVALTDDPTVMHDFGGWSPDGARVAFAANARDEAHFDVIVQDIATGVRRCVYQGTHIVTVAGWRADGARLAAVADRGYGDMSLMILDLEAGTVQPFPQPGPTNWQSVRWSRGGRTLLALTDHGGSDHLRLCRLDPESGAVTVVYAASGRDVEAWAISSDTTQLATIENDRGWSVLRVGPTGGDRPEITGLPHGIVADPAFSPDGGRLACTVAAPTEPPGLWMVEGGAARPVFRCESYGGFMVLSAITECPDLWKAAVDYYGIADFRTALAGTGPWRRNHRAAEYGDPERDEALLERISPLGRADRVRVPLLTLHGTRDPRVPIGESEQFVRALRERQKPVEYLVFDYAGHGFIRPADRQRAHAAVTAFFAKHL